MAGTTAPATTAAFVAATTPEQRDLALELDYLHSTWMHTPCVDGEAEAIWAELVRHATDRSASAFPHRCYGISAEEADEAIATMRRLGGTWAEGCLNKAGTAEEYLAAGEDHCAEYFTGPAHWVSLEEMARRTGLALPGA